MPRFTPNSVVESLGSVFGTDVAIMCFSVWLRAIDFLHRILGTPEYVFRFSFMADEQTR